MIRPLIDPALTGPYRAHVADCDRCRAVDAKKPGAQRCGEGVRLLLDAIDGSEKRPAAGEKGRGE